MTSRYDFQDILDRFSASQSISFRELSDAIARRIIALLGGGSEPVEPPATPTGLTATDNLEFRIDLNWSPVADVLGYNVYRAPVGTTTFTQIATSALSEYSDVGLPADTGYSYYVTAYNGNGESGPSIPENGFSVDGSAPALPDVPANFQVLDATDTVTLGWDAYTGGTIAVRVERSNDQVNWSTVATVNTTTFNDTNVTVGQTFHYRAYGLNATGINSVSTPVLSVLVLDGDTTAPPVPFLATRAFSNKAVDLTWESVIASDLAGYEVGYSTTTGVYTTVSGLLTGTSTRVTGLTNGTQYFFAVRSVDTSTNQNRSAWSNEKNSTPIDLALPGNPPPAPTAPTGLTATSPTVDAVRVNFTPGVTPHLIRNRLYGRVKPGQLVAGVPVSGVWSQLDQELAPATVLGKDVVVFTGNYSYAISPVTWEFYVTSVDTYSQESPASAIVETVVDGSDWAFGPGSGAIMGGAFNGDSLGDNHRVPGYVFDYVIDVSDDSLYTGDAVERAAALFNSRRSLSPTNPGYIQLSTDDAAQIAILLPTKTVNRRLAINAGETPSASMEVADFNFDGDPGFETQVELHFVGPWAMDSENITDAQLRMRDTPETVSLGYRRTFKDEDNKSLLPDGTGWNVKIGDITRQSAKGAYFFWNWDVEVSAGVGVFLGDGDDRGDSYLSHDFDTVFGMCKLHQDAVAPNTTSIGRHGFDARYLTPSLGGCYIDLPWQSKSAVRVLSPLRGNFEFSRTRIRSCGGSAFELRTRAGRDAGLPTGTDPGTLLITGLRHWDEWSGPTGQQGGIGRASAVPVPFFDIDGIEQDVYITDCEVIEEIPTNFRPAGIWPPANVYDWRIYAALVNSTSQVLTMTRGTDTRPRSDGYYNGDLTITGCNFYSKAPIDSILAVDSAKSVTLTDSGFFTAEEQAISTYDSSNLPVSAGMSGVSIRIGADGELIGSCDATDINPTDRRTELNSVYGISAGNTRVEETELFLGGTKIEHFEVTTDFSFGTFTAPLIVNVNPSDLVPAFPSLGTTINALDMDDLGLTHSQYKGLIVPGVRAGRAARQVIDGFQFQEWQENYPTYPGGIRVKINNKTDENDWPSWVQFDATRRIFTMENVYSDGRGVANSQANFYGPYSGPMVEGPDEQNLTGSSPEEDRAKFDDPTHPRPSDNEVRVINSAWDGTFYGLSEPNRPKWGTRGYNMSRQVYTDSDFGPIFKEHGVYNCVSYEGYIRMNGCTFLETGGQGFQMQHRRDNYIGGRDGECVGFTQSPDMVIENSHFVDCGANPYGQMGSVALTIQNCGEPDKPADITVRGCSFVAGNQNALPPSGNYWSTGGITSGIEGNQTNSTVVNILSRVQQKMAEAGRTVGTIYRNWTVENCYFFHKNPDKKLVKFSSAETITLKDCVLRSDHTDDVGVTQGNLISVDHSNGPGFQELYGVRLLIINCRFHRNFEPGFQRPDETSARIDIGGPGGAQRFVTVPTCENQEIEVALGNHPDVLSGAASLGDIVYQGAIR